MALISDKILKIKPSSTLSVVAKANELKSKGLNIISLGAGEPDFDTPQNIKDKAIKAIQDGFTKYTTIDGITELKAAISEKFKKENQLEYSLDQISVANGAKQIIFNAFLATLNIGDEVIIPTPYWGSYSDIVEIADGTSVFVETKEENGFLLSAKALEKAITPKTKWLLLNSPSNPSGATFSKEQLKELAEVLLRYPHIYVMSDDIYEHIIFDGIKYYTLAQIEPKLIDRILTVNGVSKAYAMTGWRIGYAGGPKELIKKMATIQSQSTSNPCSISQIAALAALTGPQDFIATSCKAFQERRNYVVSRINNIPGLTCKSPQGAFYVFPNCKELIGKKTLEGKEIKNTNEFCEYLLEAGLVAVVPGAGFGDEGYFRISFATSLEILKEALDRIEVSCKKLTNL